MTINLRLLIFIGGRYQSITVRYSTVREERSTEGEQTARVGEQTARVCGKLNTISEE